MNCPRSTRSDNNTMSLVQKKALELCFRCGDKYHSGHRFGNKTLHTMYAEGDDEESQGGGEQEENMVKEKRVKMTVRKRCKP